ncbi:hypothetical protein [Oceanobacillus sp. Castelsardo]|uniref:hypothetical protein n=1 Tax=Oceanobacillus sp. Castelsardo TaxID=1851204 RepID=UPI000838A1C0|nr:hypothetical protein [Oceanobacillus sp. Castelsardo]
MESISTIILLIIFYILYKKGILCIRSQTYLFYKMKRTSNRLSVSYKKYDGLEHYSFWVKKGSKVTVSYNVTVEVGSLLLEWRDLRNNCYFKKEFYDNESVTFSFEATRRLYSIEIHG